MTNIKLYDLKHIQNFCVVIASPGLSVNFHHHKNVLLLITIDQSSRRGDAHLTSLSQS